MQYDLNSNALQYLTTIPKKKEAYPKILVQILSSIGNHFKKFLVKHFFTTPYWQVLFPLDDEDLLRI